MHFLLFTWELLLGIPQPTQLFPILCAFKAVNPYYRFITPAQISLKSFIICFPLGLSHPYVFWLSIRCSYFYTVPLTFSPLNLSWAEVSSVAQSCPTLCDPMDCSTPGFLSIIHSHGLLKLMSTESVMPSNHLILCHLLLLLSIFPSIRGFSNESVLYIRWPKYWSFSFSISPSNEYSGLISLRMDWLDLLSV